ncbi:diguanylate cyclase domain-containing protein [Modestobacter lapidis]|nr:diguanylate cyclase [Modestobacter lapidis]
MPVSTPEVSAVDLLDVPEDAELDAIVRIAAAVTGMAMATVNVLDTHRQAQLASVGFPRRVTPRNESLCTRALEAGSVFASADLSTDDRFSDSPWVDGRRDEVRGYAMVPLQLDGGVVGTLCVQDREVRALSADQLDRLRDLGTVVVALLERRRQSRRTTELARASSAAHAEATAAHDELAAAHAALTSARAFDEALLDALPVAVVAADPSGRVTVFNRVSRLWHGTDSDPTLLPEEFAQHFTLRTADATRLLAPGEVPLTRLFREGRLEDVEISIVPDGSAARVVSCNGAAVRGPDGSRLGAVIVMSDVTAQRELEDRLRTAALHDPLTGLPNRSLLVDRLDLALSAAGRDGAPLAVLYCDLDGFKAVNDGWGHAAGDAVLTGAAGRLSAAVRPGDTVARIGGDEFVLLCPGIEDRAAAQAVADRVVAAMETPLPSGAGRVHRVGISVGVALSTPDSAPEALLTAADQAMYRVKWARRRLV